MSFSYFVVEYQNDTKTQHKINNYFINGKKSSGV